MALADAAAVGWRYPRSPDLLKRRQFVRRELDPADGRYTNAILTPAGLRLLTASAPAHVATVRELVIDALTQPSCDSYAPPPSRSCNESKPAPDSQPPTVP